MMIIAGLEAGRHDDVWACPDAALRGHSADQHPGDTFIMTALASDTRDRIDLLFAALMVTRRKANESEIPLLHEFNSMEKAGRVQAILCCHDMISKKKYILYTIVGAY
ncbi:hypothetical protein DsansV1_C32g0221791 [Dioscorea sansibarensis]